MFSTLAALEKSGLSRIDLTLDSASNSSSGCVLRPLRTRCRGRGRATSRLPSPAGHRTRHPWGGGGSWRCFRVPLRLGGVFPREWLNMHISKKDMFALYHLLWRFYTRQTETLRRAQVLIDVDNKSVVGAFKRGRARDHETHALLVQLFELQVEYGFMLSLKWVLTAANGVADAISRPSRELKSRSRRTPLRSCGTPWVCLTFFRWLPGRGLSASWYGGVAIIFPIRLRELVEGGCLVLGCFQDSVHGRTRIRVLFSPTVYGRPLTAALGGVQRTRGDSRPGYKRVLVPDGEAVHGSVSGGGPEKPRRFTREAWSGRYTQRVAVPQMAHDGLRGRLPVMLIFYCDWSASPPLFFSVLVLCLQFGLRNNSGGGNALTGTGSFARKLVR